MSILQAIRSAMQPGGSTYSAQADEPGADASISQPPLTGADEKGVVMSDDQNAPGGAKPNAGISETAHQAAVFNATTAGMAAGARAANERLAGILGADGIKGDGKRMAAALDLAIKSPDMSAADVTGFIAGNVPDGKSPGAAYEEQRLAAAGLAVPAGNPGTSPAKASLNPAAIYDSRHKALKGV